jgi:hypothetical protein
MAPPHVLRSAWCTRLANEAPPATCESAQTRSTCRMGFQPLFGSNMSIMNGRTHLAAWVSVETKQRFSAMAQQLGLTESALLKRMVDITLQGARVADTAFPTPPEKVARGAPLRPASPGRSPAIARAGNGTRNAGRHVYFYARARAPTCHCAASGPRACRTGASHRRPRRYLPKPQPYRPSGFANRFRWRGQRDRPYEPTSRLRSATRSREGIDYREQQGMGDRQCENESLI